MQLVILISDNFQRNFYLFISNCITINLLLKQCKRQISVAKDWCICPKMHKSFLNMFVSPNTIALKKNSKTHI